MSSLIFVLLWLVIFELCSVCFLVLVVNACKSCFHYLLKKQKTKNKHSITWPHYSTSICKYARYTRCFPVIRSPCKPPSCFRVGYCTPVGHIIVERTLLMTSLRIVLLVHYDLLTQRVEAAMYCVLAQRRACNNVTNLLWYSPLYFRRLSFTYQRCVWPSFLINQSQGTVYVLHIELFIATKGDDNAVTVSVPICLSCLCMMKLSDC